MTEPSLAHRLDRFEQKLDKVADALSTLARMEERQAFTHETLARFGKRLDDHDVQIGALHRAGDVHKTKIGFGERVWWLLLGLATSGLAAIVLTRAGA
jgi:streptomycin 6-kinase